jgi:polyisoprenoid-binding protein YceI
MYSDDAKLTTHLKSPDFFEVKKFPQAKFVTTKVVRVGLENKVTGDLTMHGKTKSVTFPINFKHTLQGLNADATLKIDRTQWGITYGKGMIDDEVAIVISIAGKK